MDEDIFFNLPVTWLKSKLMNAMNHDKEDKEYPLFYWIQLNWQWFLASLDLQAI